MFYVTEKGLGIGVEDPSAKLAVNGDGKFNGTLYAKEVRVNTNFWPDYVFASNYQMMPLDKLEKHIKMQKHLPGIPSAKELEANGVNMGEMQKKLLEKIEELTLHVIALNKNNEILYQKYISKKKIFKKLNLKLKGVLLCLLK